VYPFLCTIVYVYVYFVVYVCCFLADRTNGRAYATVLRLSVRLSVVCDVMYCGQMVRPRAKVTIESL